MPGAVGKPPRPLALLRCKYDALSRDAIAHHLFDELALPGIIPDPGSDNALRWRSAAFLPACSAHVETVFTPASPT